MEEVREAFKRGVECIYYVREKKMKIASPISLGIAAFFYVLISLFLNAFVGAILNDYSVLSMKNSFAIVGAIGLIFFTMNVFTGQSNFYKNLLEHMYLNRNVKHPVWITFIRICVSIFLLFVIYNCCMPIFEKVSVICQMNEIETLIMIMVVTFGGAYFLLTDTIIENFRRYRAKSIAAVLLILSLSFLYSWQLSEASTSSFDVYGVIIFGLGLLALLDTAVNNYREMFRCLREEHKEELENYLKSVTEYYDVKFEQVENRISNIKDEWMSFVDIWKKSPRKKKISFVLIILALIAFFAGISFLSIKISGKMIWGCAMES